MPADYTKKIRILRNVSSIYIVYTAIKPYEIILSLAESAV